MTECIDPAALDRAFWLGAALAFAGATAISLIVWGR